MFDAWPIVSKGKEDRAGIREPQERTNWHYREADGPLSDEVSPESPQPSLSAYQTSRSFSGASPSASRIVTTQRCLRNRREYSGSILIVTCPPLPEGAVSLKRRSSLAAMYSRPLKAVSRLPFPPI